ncbi:DNA-binding transcriptional regulator, MarR family [Paenibacillus catalpae]|uniref:DNA-binding transcriptional regulator, MarR family n=1 Tax=Paenibacillus catalpae TaxID=1045775 RepID=A0A1I1WNX9_9BACL|nr:MarR family winged helix-turn-helix transcriptional regulator [Paenibacillus catalpae]SFD96782.1 DNA-binding transcriptional regulator, MarR family [Paenibacillus catalpae]
MEQQNDSARTEQYNAPTAGLRYPVSFSIFALARSHRALAGQMLRDIGLFPGQEIMLLQLWDNDGQSQQSLGRTIGVDHSTVAKSVKRLEESGLVTRTRSPEDGRVTLVWLTEAGRNLEAKVNIIWKELEQITVNGLTESERKQIESLAYRISSSIDSVNKEN